MAFPDRARAMRGPLESAHCDKYGSCLWAVKILDEPRLIGAPA
jgi:hypothetical protein